MTQKTYLVLGAAGFIGSNLCNALVKEGNRVRAFDRIIPEDKIADSIKWVPGDFLNKEDIRKAVQGCDVVYHLISMTIPATSNANPYFDAESNILGTINLLEAAVEAGVKKVIFVSSGGTVYGITEHKAIKEKHATNPITAYGVGKLAIEKYLHLYHHNKGLDYCILRVANPYGLNQKGTGGQGVIGAFLNKITNHEPLEIWGDGMVVRDYIHVSDVASAMVKAKDYTGSHHLFNIGSGHGHSLNDILGILERLLGRPIEKRYTPGRLLDVPVNILDSSLAQEELGWQPQVPLDQGIEQLLKLYL